MISMSEVKHTPGPWEAHRTTRGDFQIRFGGKGAWLAEVFDDDEPVDGRTEADAHLIAAAPEMLEALKGFNLREDWIVSGSADAVTLRVPITVIQAAAAAVSKAEGRS